MLRQSDINYAFRESILWSTLRTSADTMHGIRVDSTPSSPSASILMCNLSQSAGSAVYIDENPFIRRHFKPTNSLTG